MAGRRLHYDCAYRCEQQAKPGIPRRDSHHESPRCCQRTVGEQREIGKPARALGGKRPDVTLPARLHTRRRDRFIHGTPLIAHGRFCSFSRIGRCLRKSVEPICPNVRLNRSQSRQRRGCKFQRLVFVQLPEDHHHACESQYQNRAGQLRDILHPAHRLIQRSEPLTCGQPSCETSFALSLRRSSSLTLLSLPAGL